MSAEPLTLESVAGQAPGCRILRLNGPLTLASLFEFQNTLRTDPPPALILDLTGVPYMDSAGMGAIINYFVSSQRAWPEAGRGRRERARAGVVSDDEG